MIIIGDREAQKGEISVRGRDGKQQNGLKTHSFLEEIKKQIESKSIV
jgi:threonyl-tRNA synthetase